MQPARPICKRPRTYPLIHVRAQPLATGAALRSNAAVGLAPYITLGNACCLAHAQPLLANAVSGSSRWLCVSASGMQGCGLSSVRSTSHTPGLAEQRPVSCRSVATIGSAYCGVIGPRIVVLLTATSCNRLAAFSRWGGVVWRRQFIEHWSSSSPCSSQRPRYGCTVAGHVLPSRARHRGLRRGARVAHERVA